MNGKRLRRLKPSFLKFRAQYLGLRIGVKPLSRLKIRETGMRGPNRGHSNPHGKQGNKAHTSADERHVQAYRGTSPIRNCPPP